VLNKGYFWLADRLYNELAWVYDPVSRMVSLGQWPAWRKWALDYLVGRRVLEIGYGTGELLLEMARRRMDAWGLEYSAAMQRLAAAKLRRRGMWVPCVRGRAQQMPFADSSFDTIIATFPAGYIFEPATLREVARILHGPAASAGGEAGRFVVVGISASSTRMPLRGLFQFLIGIPMEDLLAGYRRMAESANLRVQVVMRKHGVLDLPIIIAERQV
jgi:ubiquinone/menaquinone biosynthesis C-methylase UbiE